MTEETGEGKIPLVAGGSPVESGRPTAVGRRASGLGVSPIDEDPDLVRRAVGGSPQRACGSDGGRAEGCTR
jgi:hypothetical protein